MCGTRGGNFVERAQNPNPRLPLVDNPLPAPCTAPTNPSSAPAALRVGYTGVAGGCSVRGDRIGEASECAGGGSFDQERDEVPDRASVEPVERGVDRLVDHVGVEIQDPPAQAGPDGVDVLGFADVHTENFCPPPTGNRSFPRISPSVDTGGAVERLACGVDAAAVDAHDIDWTAAAQSLSETPCGTYLLPRRAGETSR
ncbi:hypothetical protein RW1_022_00030 [Rhodococcus wratislaviensis NBRC 100605]|uniref:Uncharacterized protein n=1 Tax=Rhodococcus wratislaviensis NBRC 100605 TaxID=1219028 RepID=X0PRB9_RHOWR|nr:hypothetical protein RW1_022_00030 [Rhodococcus wratislaviensis NBRC 100605]